MKMIGINGLIVTMLLLPSVSVFAESNAPKYVDDIYKKSINNIMSSDECSKEEFILSKPHQIHDDGEEMQSWSKTYTKDAFVDFFANSGKFESVEIALSPPPESYKDQLIGFCVVSAIQSAINPKISFRDYMQRNSDMYSEATKSGKSHYPTSKFDYSVIVDGIRGAVFTIAPKE